MCRRISEISKSNNGGESIKWEGVAIPSWGKSINLDKKWEGWGHSNPIYQVRMTVFLESKYKWNENKAWWGWDGTRWAGMER